MVLHTQCANIEDMRSTVREERNPRTRGRLAVASLLLPISALALSACGGSTEYPGEFTVANGDSTYYVGDGPHRPESVTAECSEQGGVITATITETKSGNTFTTTQPEEGRGYAGGTLTLGDGGEEFTWVPLDSATDEDMRGAGGQVFEDEMQEGAPVLWAEDGTFQFQYGGLSQKTTKTDDGMVTVGVPGGVSCMEPSA